MITQVPAPPPNPPTIISVVSGGGNTVTLNFSDPIRLNRWTCIKHNASWIEKCLGFLPGDVSGNATAAPVDILSLIDNLNGVRIPPLFPYQCDIDRSGVCAPVDILTEIDLLNGVNGYPIQNNRVLPVCPSAP